MAKQTKTPETQSPQMIAGLNIAITDDNTGAPAGHHVITALYVDLAGGYGQATLASYYNQAQHAAGKQPMGSTTITLYGVPPRGVDVLDWAYRSIAARLPEDAVDAYGQPIVPHQFAGAELVMADVPPDQADTAAAESLPEDGAENDPEDGGDGE